MNRLGKTERAQVLAALGKATVFAPAVRMTGVAKNTVVKLLKKIDNLRHAVALHFMYYNFCRVHQTLRVTPAMEAGIADHVWTVDEGIPT